LGEGGSGYDYVIVRFNVSELRNLFPRGTAVSAGFRAFADSVDDDDRTTGDSAWDDVGVGVWNIPN
jgi:hypothetical protein